jgi:periplasmic divalent cation tolerance protein
MTQPAELPILLLWTSPNPEEADTICKSALERRLVACATMLSKARSLYIWEGKLCESSEVQVLFKTTRACIEPLAAWIQSSGSYKNPELLGLPAEWSSVAYARWVRDTVEPPHGP